MTPQRSEPLRMVILISGRGSNLDAFINNIHDGNLQAKLAGVISSRANAAGLKFARTADIPITIIDRATMADQTEFNNLLLIALDEFRPDLVVLAGFMHILDNELVDKYVGRMLNIHPSLLPKYRGLETYRRALAARDSHHGTSVHFVTRELDGGPVVLQVRIAIGTKDTEQTLATRVQACEHVVYSITINWFAEKRLQLSDGHAELDGQPLLEPVIMDELKVLDGKCEIA